MAAPVGPKIRSICFFFFVLHSSRKSFLFFGVFMLYPSFLKLFLECTMDRGKVQMWFVFLVPDVIK